MHILHEDLRAFLKICPLQLAKYLSELKVFRTKAVQMNGILIIC
jgi:hypothetical protein